MAEFAGIALAVLGVFSMLLNVARGSYNIFLRAQLRGAEFSKFQYELNYQRMIFEDWGERLSGDHGSLARLLSTEPVTK
jgi:hypothetical protein